MTNQLMKELTDLNSRHRKWEDQQRVKNNDLYDMMADTMRIVTDVRSDGSETTIEKSLSSAAFLIRTRLRWK